MNFAFPEILSRRSLKLIMAIAFCFIHVRSFAANEQAPFPAPKDALEVKLIDSGLSPGAQRLLRRYVLNKKPWVEFNVEDIVRINAVYVRKSLYSPEIIRFLAVLGLRFEMTSHEIEFYRVNGRLPEGHEGITEATDVASLMLSPRAIKALLGVGIERISDRRKVSLEEIRTIEKTSPVTTKEIEAVFRNLGYPLYHTAAERCEDTVLRNNRSQN